MQPANNMHRPRDVKNMFVELSSLSDTLKQAGWNNHDLEIFLNGFMQCGFEVDVFRLVFLCLIIIILIIVLQGVHKFTNHLGEIHEGCN